jgi:hypothetical protein
MKLITRKSECRPGKMNSLVKSPKEAIRRTLSNYEVKNGLIVKAYQPSYVSKEALVLRNMEAFGDFAVMLDKHNMLVNTHN